MQCFMGLTQVLANFVTICKDTPRASPLYFLLCINCLLACGNSITNKNSEWIKKMKNTAVRFVYNICRRDHVSAFYDAGNIVPVGTLFRVPNQPNSDKKQRKYLVYRLVS